MNCLPVIKSKSTNALKLFACAAILLLGSLAQAAEQARLALVIGNADYSAAPLKNPVNDANAVADKLQGLGFEVIKLEDATQAEMISAMRDFTRQAADNQVRLVYYAGHGVQIKGRNYLMPVDAKVQIESDIRNQGVDMSAILKRLAEIKQGVNLVILDACRNNPFTVSTTQLASLRAQGIRTRAFEPEIKAKGLAQELAPAGTVVAFSTSPGSVAIDNTEEEQSIYTKHFLSYISKPGMPVEQFFKKVRIAVYNETGQKQVPWESSSLMGDFCFKPDENGQCGS